MSICSNSCSFSFFFFFLMIRRPPRSTLSSSSAASDVYKRQGHNPYHQHFNQSINQPTKQSTPSLPDLSLIHISEPTRLLSISYAVFCLKKKKKKKINTSIIV
eukprot:TRINITY_DN9983_c0_g1_i5.p1 TRINITY_DN9983_c0_g1~~TRINITY_DN9983_c0_g1_i5.p1  ORF type:complete len:103 (+),score=43.00 TRINITY_DN9983_c0_g1_i5:101-409(+)